jgi:WD40 repeat protein
MKHIFCLTLACLLSIGCLRAEETPAFVELKGHSGAILDIVFSPDGQKIATGSSIDKTIRIWNVETGKELHRLENQTGRGWGTLGWQAYIAFSPDSKKVLTCRDADKSARILDADTGKELLKLPEPFAAFSPNGKIIISCGKDEIARIVDIESGSATFGKVLLELKGHTTTVSSAVFSPDGKKAATLGDVAVRIWDTQSGKELQKLEEPNNPGFAPPDEIWYAIFSPDGKKIITQCRDTGPGVFVKIWDAESGKKLMEIKQPEDIRGTMWGGKDISVQFAEFSPDGKKIVTTCFRGKTFYIWDADTGEELHRMSAYTPALSPDGKRIVATDLAACARIWNVDTGVELQRVEHGGICAVTVFSPDGKKVVTTSSDGTARIWDLKQIPVLPPPVRPAIRDY